MDVALQLKRLIEQWAEEYKAENPVIKLTEKGQLTRFQLANYTYNIIYLTLQGFCQLRLNRSLAAQQGLWDLLEFYDQKIIEEAGHEKWAENDLKALKLTPEEKRHLEVLPSALRLSDHVYAHSFKNPTLLMTYFYFVEYFTVLAGKVWLEEIKNKTTFSQNQLTIYANHVILDQDHAEEGLEVVGNFIQKYPDLLRLEEAETYLTTAVRYFNQFTDEVVKSDQRIPSSRGTISDLAPMVSP